MRRSVVLLSLLAKAHHKMLALHLFFNISLMKMLTKFEISIRNSSQWKHDEENFHCETHVYEFQGPLIQIFYSPICMVGRE